MLVGCEYGSPAAACCAGCSWLWLSWWRSSWWLVLLLLLLSLLLLLLVVLLVAAGWAKRTTPKIPPTEIQASSEAGRLRLTGCEVQ